LLGINSIWNQQSEKQKCGGNSALNHVELLFKSIKVD
jgi:hypothetical protein